MDDVKVHYNSDKPAQMKAHVYAHGTGIDVAPYFVDTLIFVHSFCCAIFKTQNLK
ncbi:hypothetical protein [Fulvivirga marina]|nr:hypothetical protein [Fulvivirga marina]